MSAKVRRIEEAEYKELYSEMEGRSVYVSLPYIKALSSIRKMELYGIERGKRVAAIFPILRKKKFFAQTALQPPFTQYFNILLRKEELEERESLKRNEEIIGAYCDFLKRSFILFSLPMHPYLQDMRTFQWRGIRVKPNYTYQVSAGPLGAELVNGRISRKAEGRKLVKSVHFGNAEEFYSALKKAYGGRQPVGMEDYKTLLGELEQKRMIDIYSDESAGAVLLRDEDGKTIYEYNVIGRDSGALIYNSIRDEEYDGWTFDFQGANTKSISMYKAWFSPNLVTYYRISRFL